MEKKIKNGKLPLQIVESKKKKHKMKNIYIYLKITRTMKLFCNRLKKIVKKIYQIAAKTVLYVLIPVCPNGYTTKIS